MGLLADYPPGVVCMQETEFVVAVYEGLKEFH